MLCFIMLLLLLSTATAIAIATAVLSLLFLPANQVSLQKNVHRRFKLGNN